jgi:hypothetical protein
VIIISRQYNIYRKIGKELTLIIVFNNSKDPTFILIISIIISFKKAGIYFNLLKIKLFIKKRSNSGKVKT